MVEHGYLYLIKRRRTKYRQPLSCILPLRGMNKMDHCEDWNSLFESSEEFYQEISRLEQLQNTVIESVAAEEPPCQSLDEWLSRSGEAMEQVDSFSPDLFQTSDTPTTTDGSWRTRSTAPFSAEMLQKLSDLETEVQKMRASVEKTEERVRDIQDYIRQLVPWTLDAFGAIQSIMSEDESFVSTQEG